MKKTLLLTFALLTGSLTVLQAQKLQKLPESLIPSSEPENHLRFLASDEMMGRRTGEPGNLIAARYIGEQMRLLGMKPVGDNGTYMQKVPFKNVTPATTGTLNANGATLQILEDFLVIDGDGITKLTDVPVVFMDYAWKDEETNDFKGVDVKGKIIITGLGTPKTKSPFEAMQASEAKTKMAAEAGAVALVEIFSAKVKFSMIKSFFMAPRLMLDSKKEGENAASMPHLWVDAEKARAMLTKEKTKMLSLEIGERQEQKVTSYNVAGIIEGTDPKLKNEYIVLSAHFDHVGTGKNGGGKFTAEDSIFNGSRDNAFGVSAILFASKALSQIKTKRSILVIGFTGEELGLLGSQYYAKHPLVDMNKCVYNLNCDGAGYSDTKILTMFGLDRTDCKTEIVTAAKAFGLDVIDDPAPEQNLFDRSDNVSFAAQGIPAPTFSPGFRKFDDAIFKYYHAVADNPETIDFPYLYKYCQSYAHTARLIANRKTQPKWTPGDKYEAAYKKLYNIK